MRLRLAGWTTGGKGVLLASCLGAWTLRAADSPPAPSAIEFSPPRHSTVVTNIIELGEDARATRTLDETSTRNSFGHPPGAAYSVLPRMSGSAGGVVINKRAKGPFDAMNSSGVRTPEEALQGMLLRELLNLPATDQDGQQDSKRPPLSMEALYERALGGGTENIAPPQRYDAFNARKPGDEGSRYSRMPDSRSPWGGQNLVPKDIRTLNAGATDLRQTLGLGAGNLPYELTPEGMRAKAAQASHLKRFEAALNGNYDLPGALASQSQGLPANPLARGSSPAIPGFEARDPFGVNPQKGVNPLAPPAAPTAPVPNSLQPPTLTQPPARLPLLKPFFTVPQRGF
jgi:hypothetical protein